MGSKVMELAVVADVQTADQPCDFCQRVSLVRVVRGIIVQCIDSTILSFEFESRLNRLARICKLGL